MVTRHLFTGCPYLRHFSQRIGLLYFSKTLVFACSPGISKNIGGYFSLKVSRSGVEVMFLVFIQVAFCTSERLYSFISSLPYSSISGMLQSWIQIRPLLWLILSHAIISTSIHSWCCGKHNYFILERTLLSFEISMTKSDSLFDLMVAGLLPIFG